MIPRQGMWLWDKPHLSRLMVSGYMLCGVGRCAQACERADSCGCECEFWLTSKLIRLFEKSRLRRRGMRKSGILPGMTVCNMPLTKIEIDFEEVSMRIIFQIDSSLKEV